MLLRIRTKAHRQDGGAEHRESDNEVTSCVRDLSGHTLAVSYSRVIFKLDPMETSESRAARGPQTFSKRCHDLCKVQRVSWAVIFPIRPRLTMLEQTAHLLLSLPSTNTICVGEYSLDQTLRPHLLL